MLSMCRTPLRPARSESSATPRPTPNGDTSPIPVMATRIMHYVPCKDSTALTMSPKVLIDLASSSGMET